MKPQKKTAQVTEVFVKGIYEEIGVDYPNKLLPRELLLAKRLLETGRDEDTKIVLASLEDLKQENEALKIDIMHEKEQIRATRYDSGMKTTWKFLTKYPAFWVIPILTSLFVGGFVSSKISTSLCETTLEQIAPTAK